jgi:hypothetical protein
MFILFGLFQSYVVFAVIFSFHLIVIVGVHTFAHCNSIHGLGFIQCTRVAIAHNTGDTSSAAFSTVSSQVSSSNSFEKVFINHCFVTCLSIESTNHFVNASPLIFSLHNTLHTRLAVFLAKLHAGAFEIRAETYLPILDHACMNTN